MPPYISKSDDERFLKPFPILHPGFGPGAFREHAHQPHVFQQSVTLTASMWNENDSKDKMGNWFFGEWKALGNYSPLLIGLVCGFGIVILVMSTVILWRYCLLSVTKKVCCKGLYGEMPAQQGNCLPPLSKKDNTANENGFERFHYKVEPAEKPVSLHRSATVGTMPWLDLNAGNNLKSKNPKYKNSNYNVSSNPGLAQFEPLMSQESLYTSHLYLPKLETESSEECKSLSKSTPALEDLYAKVNFSKKRKNRMRKDEAAIIAMSKSHSGQNTNSLAQFGSAIVVYNERTAL